MGKLWSRHIINAATATFAALWGLSSCIFEYPPECPGDEAAGWYPTRVDAGYDTEWFLPVTPRYASYADSTRIFGIEQRTLRPQKPAGLRVAAYPDGDDDPRTFNLPADGGTITLHAISSHLLFYNNDTEYIIIDPRAGFDKATATTRRHSAGTFKGNAAIGEGTEPRPVFSEPDMLFRASLADHSAEPGDTAEPCVKVTLDPAVFSYVIHFMVSEGAGYVSTATGAITGMAEGVYLESGTTIDNDGITILYPCRAEDRGFTGVVRSFGIPGFDSASEQTARKKRYGITLQTRLKNGRLLTFDFDVTPQIAAQPRGGVVMVGGIEIPDSIGKPSGGSGGFDVGVNPWGPSTDIDIDFGTGLH